MAAHKKTDRICCAVLILSLILTVLFMNGESLGLQASAAALGYETRLFDTTKVHTVDIVMDDWDSFIESCENEEYSACAVVIDGESYKNVAIRAKGNTSLSSVRQLGSQRYSFKIEFDHYDSGKTYHGLDKLCLNNLIQDNTMMKDYFVYRLMGQFGVASPLCSFVYITVNGEDWGLRAEVFRLIDGLLQHILCLLPLCLIQCVRVELVFQLDRVRAEADGQVALVENRLCLVTVCAVARQLDRVKIIVARDGEQRIKRCAVRKAHPLDGTDLKILVNGFFHMGCLRGPAKPVRFQSMSSLSYPLFPRLSNPFSPCEKMPRLFRRTAGAWRNYAFSPLR